MPAASKPASRMRLGAALILFARKKVDAKQDCRHQHDRRHSVRDAEVAPLDPVVSSKVIGDRKCGAPEGRTKRNDDDRDQNENDGFTKRDAIERRLYEYANPGGRQNILHGIENLALQCIERRPILLLRGEVVSASGGQRVSPPVPGGDEQQNGNEDGVRRKEQGDLAVGKSQRPGGSRRQVIAGTGGQNPEYRAERELRLFS